MYDPAAQLVNVVPFAVPRYLPPSTLIAHWLAAVLPLPMSFMYPVGHALQNVAVPPALYVEPVHCVHVWPSTIAPGFAVNAVLMVLAPHAVALVAFCFNWPALQYVLTLVAAFVWLHCSTLLQPVPVFRVQPLVAVGHAAHDVAVPPALYTAPLHCVHVWPLTMEPGFACNAVLMVLVPHAVALVAFFFN